MKYFIRIYELLEHERNTLLNRDEIQPTDIKGGGRMCHFLKPLKLTQELSQKMSYRCELWYDSCFYGVY